MKEELLKGLKELQSQLGESITEEQVKLLDEHYTIKRNLEKEISNLLDKVGNNKNYTKTREVPTTSDVLEREIANSNIRLSEAEEAITSYQLRLAEIESELTKTQNLISTSEKATSELQEAIDNQEITDLESANAQIDINRLANSQLEINLANLNEERTKIEEAVEIANNTIARENSVRESYEQQLETLSNLELGDYIDEVERAKDRKHILELQRTLNTLNTKTELLTYDLSTELSNIISDVESDILTDEQIKQRIITFYSHIPVEFFQNDYTSREEATEQLELSINENEKEITKYQEKLADDENYRYSIFEIERDEVEEERLNNKIASASVEIARLERELKRNAIQFSINHNYAVKRQRAYRTLGEEVDSSIEINYNRFLEKHSNKQDSLQNESKLLKQQLHEAKMNKKHFERDLENAKNSSSKEVVNKKAKQADEEKLQELIVIKDSLNKRKELLAYDPQEALLGMIDLVDTKTEETVVENEQNDDFPVPVPLNNLDSEVNEPTNDDIEEENDLDGINVGIVPKTKANFKEAGADLVAKARSFGKKVKEFFKKYKNAIVATGAAIVVLLTAASVKGCQAEEKDVEKENEITDVNNAELPTIDELVDNVISKTDEKEDSKKEEVKQEPVKQEEAKNEKIEIETPVVTPEYVPSYTPDYTPNYTPDYTPSYTPDYTPDVNPTPTPDVNPTPTPTPTPDVNPTPEVEPTEVTIKVNEGETLLVTDKDNQNIKIDLSEGNNDAIIGDVDTVDPTDSNAIAGMEFDYGENGDDMHANVTVESSNLTGGGLSKEDYQQLLAQVREANGLTENDLGFELDHSEGIMKR